MERWDRVKQVIAAALVKEPESRAAVVRQMCEADEALQQEVQSLLAYEENTTDFLEEPAVIVAARRGNLMTPETGLKFGRYEVISLLGVGGMGEVYRARDPRLDRTVALKILTFGFATQRERLARVLLEARAASALTHPNVATIYDVGTSKGARYIAMEYVEGRTLAQIIAEGAIDAATVVNIGEQVANALEAAHSKGITHGDIKPSNLMMTSTDQVKILDFGVAKVRRLDDSSHGAEISEQRRAAAMITGSPPYMSPEQVSGRHVDHRSDFFSLGVSLYEMITGEPPFGGESVTETINQILHEEQKSLALLNKNTPPGLDRIIRKCLEKEVERRYESAAALLLDLHNLKRQMEAHSSPTAVDKRLHNLNMQLTSFVGRIKEIAEIRQLMLSSRIVVLTGVGGCGKTRLAVEVASSLVDEFPDGVWFVDLAPLAEATQVIQSIATVLQVREGPTRTLEEVVYDFVKHRKLLLVLDNCEHLISACASLAETLLRLGPELRILATSRESLRVSGEVVWRVPALSLPEFSQELTPDTALDYESIRLFADRAKSNGSDFEVNTDNAGFVADICLQLDGIPLAIELAAARTSVLSVEELKLRLHDHLRLLKGGSRTAPSRQRALEATLDWSYGLLRNAERVLLRRLSVFRGGWTLEAAEAVCSGRGIGRKEVLDRLSSLVDKSLVSVQADATGSRRYRLLETVRQYGQQRLLRTREAKNLRERHSAFFLELARRTEPRLHQSDQVLWLNRLQVEHDNLRESLNWFLTERQGVEAGLEMAVALSAFWMKRGYFGEGVRWYECALAAAPGGSAVLRARGHVALSLVASFRGDFAAGKAHSEEGLALGRQTNDAWSITFALMMQAIIDSETIRSSETLTLAKEAQRVATEANLFPMLGGLLSIQAWGAFFLGDTAQADMLADQALTALRTFPDDKWMWATGLSDLALLRAVRGHHNEATTFSREVLPVFLELEERRGAAWCIENLAASAAQEGKARRAARLWGASDALLESVASFLLPTHVTVRNGLLNAVTNSIGESAFQSAVLEGRALSLTQAVHYALE